MEGNSDYKPSTRFLQGVSAPRYEPSAKNPRSETKEKFSRFDPEAYVPPSADRREQSKTMSLLSSGRSSLDRLPDLRRRTIDFSPTRLPPVKRTPHKTDLKPDDLLFQLLQTKNLKEKLTDQILLLQKKFDGIRVLQDCTESSALPAVKEKSRRQDLRALN